MNIYGNYLSRVIILLGLCVSFTAAQGGPPPPFGGPGTTKFEQFKKMRMIEALKLDEETSVRFIARYNNFLDEMKETGKKRNEIVDKLAEGIKNKLSDDELNAVIKELTLCDEKLLEIRTKHIQSLHDILTAPQVAEYIVFERKFNQDIREVMREMTHERMERRRNDD